MKQRRNIPSDAAEKEYEKQRIADGENIFLCFRINDHGMWTRHTYWIHFDKSGIRPVFRQRVYIDADLSDLRDDNDALVFQTNYYAFEMFEPVSTDDDVSELTGVKMLEYIENLITYAFREHADAWIDLSYPEYGIITGHQNGIYNSSYPALAPGWMNQRIYNPNHEHYLGIRSLNTDSSSLYVLFYPIGDVMALHSTGVTWVKYHQFYKSKESFELKLSQKVEYMRDRRYFVGLQGFHSLYSEDGNIINEYSNMNGFRHGAFVANSEYADFKTSVSTGYIYVDMYYYGYLAERISMYKDVEIGIHRSAWESMNNSYMLDIKEIKKAYRNYKRHCRKWQIAKTVTTQ